MAIFVNGKDMKEAVIKTDQYDMKILEFTPDLLKVSITATSEEPFNFVPRFISLVYPDTKVNNARDSGAISVRGRQAVEVPIQFSEKVRLERFMSFELRYARRRLAEISIE